MLTKESKFKKFIYRIAWGLYKCLETKPRLLRPLLRLNNKLKIIKDFDSVMKSSMGSKKIHSIHHDGNSIKSIKVAIIADEFTFNCFKYEFNALPVTPDDWQEVFAKNKPDIFFCESAWSGADPVGRPWKGKIYSSVRFKHENRSDLLQILKHCKKNQIPTVFWNKEDPIHYIDKIHNFVDTALKFDHIFTSAAECVEQYKKDYGHKSVHALMFATQPKIFNPIEEFERTDEIVFAGSWYEQHPERCIEMAKILDDIIASGRKLKIYDRHSGTVDSNHFYPEKYKPYIHPKLDYEHLSLAYKGSKYALNINTSTTSETMFARRVFELMSSNTCVLSNYSEGMKKLFGSNVFFVDDGIKISDEDNAREANLNLVLAEHTYRNRFEQILRDINFKCEIHPPLLNLVKIVDDEADIPKAIQEFKNIHYPNKKGVILLTQNIRLTRIKDLFQKFNSVETEIMSMDYLNKYELDKPLFGHFAIVDGNFENEFIQKAMLHTSYLEKDVGIQSGSLKYQVTFEGGYLNTVFHSDMFREVIEVVRNNIDSEIFKKYTI